MSSSVLFTHITSFLSCVGGQSLNEDICTWRVPTCEQVDRYPSACDTFKGCIFQPSVHVRIDQSRSVIYQSAIIVTERRYTICNGCCKFLLDGENAVSNNVDMTYSSILSVGYDGYKIFSNCLIRNQMLNAWIPDQLDTEPYIQAVFTKRINVSAIVTAGRGKKRRWTSSS